jgi:prepilin-type processing-associated H-X9-DG protein/prepilin-type N-terminal cleavage/methylation domain-containing protein
MNCASQRPARRVADGFTLVELLVVIGIIAVLVSMLLPTLRGARKAAESVRCASNLKQIHTAMFAYARDNNDYFHVSPNFGLWERPAGTLLGPDNGFAYWGVAYLRYLSKGAANLLPERNNTAVLPPGTDGESVLAQARSIFRCPSATWMDPDGLGGASAYSDPQQMATYGLNRLIFPRYSSVLARWQARRVSSFRLAAETIVAHDAVEHVMDGNGDFLTNHTVSEATSGAARGQLQWMVQFQNLTQWRVPGGASYAFPRAINEYYRHNNNCNVLWLDGHVAPIGLSRGRDVPVRWYSGTRDNRIVTP